MSKFLSTKQKYFAIFASIALSVLVVCAVVSGATTISTNITTGGSLEVGTTSTLTGVVTASTGLTVTTGGLTVTAGGLTVTAGATTIGSTLDVTGLTTMGFASTTGDVTVVGDIFVGVGGGKATTTAATGNFTTIGKIGVGTSTPVKQVSLDGTATTTLRIMTGTAKYGGCIELQGVDGLPYRLYVQKGTATSTVSGAEDGYVAVFVSGNCGANQ